MNPAGASFHPRLRAVAALLIAATTTPPGATASMLGRVDELLAAVQTIGRMDQRYEIADRSRNGLDPSMLGGRTEAAPVLPGESAEDTGPQFLVKAKPPRTPWVEFLADSQFYYTSNFALNEEDSLVGEEDTVYLLSTAQLALTPDFRLSNGTHINPRIGFRHQWYNYDIVEDDRRNNAFDFDAQTVFIEVNWWLPNDEWRVFGGVDWRRLLGHESEDPYDTFYSELVPLWGADRFVKFGDSAFLQIRYEGQYHITSVDPLPQAYINDRFEHYLTLNLAYALSPNVVLRPWYRFTYLDYTRAEWGDRNDTLNTFGLTVTWRPFQWLDLRGSFTYDIKESDDELVPDYRKFDVGPGIMAVWTF